MHLRALLLFALVILASAPARAGEPHPLRAGWYPWDPYQFETGTHGDKQLAGLDVQLLREIFLAAGREVDFERTDWTDTLRMIQDGRQDIAGGAYRTPDREAYAWFSDPYRTETDILVVPRGRASAYAFKSVADMLKAFAERGFRLGVVRGYSYGPEADAWLRDPAHAGNIRYAEDDNTSLTRLLRGEIDGFFADRLVAATAAWRQGVLHRVEEYPVPVYTAGIHVIFSRKTCTPETVAAFNEGLRQLKASGEYHRIAQYYGLPVLLGITIYRPWFFALDLAGTVAFAISGVLLARRERYDIFGAFVLAALPAVGGGTLRDLLTGRDPIGVLRTPDYLYAILATVVAGLIFYKVTDALRARRAGGPDDSPAPRLYLPKNIYQFFDAVGLAAFTVIGVVVAVEQQCQPLWLWGPLLAALTGAGGGILRDMLRADSHNPSLKGGFYPEVALIWGLILSLFLKWEAARLNLREVFFAVILTLLGALATRLLAIRFRIQSPFFYDRRAGSPDVLLDAIRARQIAWLRQWRDLLAEGRPGADPGTRETLFNVSRAEAASISDQLTALSAVRLPDAQGRRFIALRQRQDRCTAMQNDLGAFVEAAPHLLPMVLAPMAESLQAWLETFLEILETPADTGSRALLIKSLDHRKSVLAPPDEDAPAAPGKSPHTLQATAAFERFAANLAGLLALEARRE